MKRKWIFMATLCLILLFAGCEDTELKYVVDEQFRGKWETGERGEYGWLIKERTMIFYENGEVYQMYEDVYSDTSHMQSQYDIFYISDQSALFHAHVNGDILTIGGSNWTHTCRRVNNFRWEGQ